MMLYSKDKKSQHINTGFIKHLEVKTMYPLFILLFSCVVFTIDETDMQSR